MQLPTLCRWQNSSFLFLKVLPPLSPRLSRSSPDAVRAFFRFQNLTSLRQTNPETSQILEFGGTFCPNCGVMNTNDVYKLYCPALISTIIPNQATQQKAFTCKSTNYEVIMYTHCPAMCALLPHNSNYHLPTLSSWPSVSWLLPGNLNYNLRHRHCSTRLLVGKS